MKDRDRPVVLVTGGVKRSGLAIALEFARAGYDVALQYLTSAREVPAAKRKIKQLGATIGAYQADLGDDRAVAALVQSVVDDFGQLDVLVNNASVFFQDRLDDFDVEQLDHAWAINCRAPLLLTRRFHDYAKRAGRTGAVINIVDQKVLDNFQADHFSYTVGKTAIGHLTKMLAISCLPVLRVNAVFPGLLLPSDDQSSRDFLYAKKKSSLLGYTATPEDIGLTAVEFAKPGYNGADLAVDAGQNLIPVDQDVIYKYKSPKRAAKKL